MDTHLITAFPILNLKNLKCSYRAYTIKGIPEDERIFENLQRLRGIIAYAIKQPVALVRQSGGYALAVPANAEIRNLKIQLIPDIATLEPNQKIHQINFGSLDEDNRDLAHAFVQYALKAPLITENRLWSNVNEFYFKKPINLDRQEEIDIFEGFKINTVEVDGQVCVGVQIMHKYVDRKPLLARFQEFGFPKLKDKRALYLYGERWFFVRILADLKCSIKNAEFTHEVTRELCNVYDFTLSECKGCERPFIKSLDPNGQAFEYEYPGNKKKRKGAFELARLSYPTSHNSVKPFHHLTILHPQKRFERVQEWVRAYLTAAKLDSQRIEVSTDFAEVRPQRFFIPDLLYGNSRILHVSRHKADDGVSIHEYGRTKKRLLYNPGAGPLCDTFPKHQVVFVPDSLPRAYLDATLKPIEDRAEKLTGIKPVFQPILYELRNQTIKKQIDAVKTAASRAHVSGYGLFILGETAHPDLHNFVKEEFWPDFQFQCLDESQLLSYFPQRDRQAQEGSVGPLFDRTGEFQSYIENVLFGLMIVNRAWIFGLTAPTHYDVHVGIDVLNRLAGFSFIFEGGRKAFFYGKPAPQKERLPRSFLRNTLYEQLCKSLSSLSRPVESILFSRDGNSYGQELQAVGDVVKLLRKDKMIAPSARYDVIELHKYSSLALRMAMVDLQTGRKKNPWIGRYLPIGRTDGLVWTTGRPFQFRGTSNPLLFRLLTDGRRDYIAEDIFSFSQLTLPAPDKCMRLPIFAWLNDFFLEASAGVTEKMRRHAEEEEEFEAAEEENENVVRELERALP